VAVAFGAIGTKASGTTTVVLGYPTGITAEHLAIACRVCWTAAAGALSDEAGWTAQGRQEGGTGSSVDNHTTEVGIDTLELVGSESGSVTFDTPGAGGAIGFILRYSKDAAETWDLAYAEGTDDTHGADRSVTASTSIALAVGDVVVAVVATDTDAALTITSPAITASGITFGATTRRSPSSAGSTSGVDGNIEVFDAEVTSGSGTAAPALAFTTATSQCGPVAFLRLRDVASGQSAAAGTATETDTALAVGRAKTAATTVATETDTAPALTRVKTRTVNLSTETDTAPAVTPPPAGFTPAVEADTAPAIGRRHTQAIGPAVETDTAITLTRAKTRSLTVAVETDSAAAVVRGKTRNVTVAAETDTAQLVGRAKTHPVGIATATNTAQAIGIQSGSTLGVATETDAAIGFGHRKQKTLGIPVDTQTSLTIGRVKVRALSPATDTSQAITLSRVHSRLLAPALEASQALTLLRLKRLGVGVAVEVELAVALFTVEVGKPVDDPRLTFTIVQATLMLTGPPQGTLELTTIRPALDLTGAHP